MKWNAASSRTATTFSPHPAWASETLETASPEHSLLADWLYLLPIVEALREQVKEAQSRGAPMKRRQGVGYSDFRLSNGERVRKSLKTADKAEGERLQRAMQVRMEDALPMPLPRP